MSNRVTKLLTAVILIGAPASALASPRTLANGAPACGNTMGKGGYGKGCTAEERTEWREDQGAADDRALHKLRAERAARKAQARAVSERAGARALADLLATALPWRLTTKG